MTAEQPVGTLIRPFYGEHNHARLMPYLRRTQKLTMQAWPVVNRRQSFHMDNSPLVWNWARCSTLGIAHRASHYFLSGC
jgi:hypothetical protein